MTNFSEVINSCILRLNILSVKITSRTFKQFFFKEILLSQMISKAHLLENPSKTSCVCNY
jgi:hypothetical protein